MRSSQIVHCIWHVADQARTAALWEPRLCMATTWLCSSCSSSSTSSRERRRRWGLTSPGVTCTCIAWTSYRISYSWMMYFGCNCWIHCKSLCIGHRLLYVNRECWGDYEGGREGGWGRGRLPVHCQPTAMFDDEVISACSAAAVVGEDESARWSKLQQYYR